MTKQTLMYRGALFVALFLTATGIGNADDSAQRLPGQAARTAQKPASSPATPTLKPAVTLPAASASRAAAPPAASKLSGDQMVEALKGMSISRDGKTRTIGVAPRLMRMLKARGRSSGAIVQSKPGKLVQINQTEVSPYAAVGLLANGCTGALIGKRFVLTAGYCVYDTQKNQWDQNLDFYPGINGDKQPFGGAKWKNAWAPQGFTKDKNENFDWALIELETEIGEQAGWFGFGYNNDLPFKAMKITGYPGGKNMGVPDFSMWQAACQLGKPLDAALVYSCPKSKAMGGFWGAPVWVGSDTPDKADWTIYGVHAGAFQQGHWAVRLNQVNYETLVAWIEEAEKAGGGGGGGTDTSGTDTGETDTAGTDTGGTDTDNPDIGGTGTGTDTGGNDDTGSPDIGPACKCKQ